jgi:DASH complex subunit SPC19
MKMQQLRQKKERLSFAIDRLQMQAQQRERQLRKSMAAQPQILEEMDF